ADECFVLGDNTLRSSDSRFFGPVKWDQVTGVVTMRYWPPSRAKILRKTGEPLP
ncbi:MAG: S26 family signal peptidase, partial [Pirellulaceae bacterium]|nr:S26 family signal peptidase [Pirellulaceae bacterium]